MIERCMNKKKLKNKKYRNVKIFFLISCKYLKNIVKKKLKFKINNVKNST